MTVTGVTETASLPSSLEIGEVGVFVGLIPGDGVDFHHTFTFETTDDAIASATAVSVEIPDLLGIEDLLLSLNGATWAPFIQEATAAAYANTLEVKGTTTGRVGGNYKADIALSYVPLPGAGVLLGSGLVVLAGWMRRRTG